MQMWKNAIQMEKRVESDFQQFVSRVDPLEQQITQIKDFCEFFFYKKLSYHDIQWTLREYAQVVTNN
jgi:hypothetical protein